MTLPKWKWWQWTLTGFAGLIALGGINQCINPKTLETKKTALQAQAAATMVNSTERVRPEPFPTFTLLITPGDGGEVLADKARDLCGSSAFCSVDAWADETLRARGFPYTDREASGVVFSYRINRNTGFEQSLWDCDVFPSLTPDSCLG